MNAMKRVLVMALLLIAVISLALTRGLPKENDILMPHTSASPAREAKPDEKRIPLGSNMAKEQDDDIRIIKRGESYVLQIRHENLSLQEYELKTETEINRGL